MLSPAYLLDTATLEPSHLTQASKPTKYSTRSSTHKHSSGQTLSARILARPALDSLGRWNKPGLAVLKRKLDMPHRLMLLRYSSRWQLPLLRGSFMEPDQPRPSMERSIIRSDLASRRRTTLIQENTQAREALAEEHEAGHPYRNIQMPYPRFPPLSLLSQSRMASLPFL